MKNILSSLLLTISLIVLFSVIYTVIILGISKASPNQGKGETISLNGKIVGYQKIGQSFTSENYFWGRPSAVNYNAAGSGGSNKGPSNSDYLAVVQARIDSFLVHHPYLKVNEIPSEMVTASSSGLDPHISPQSALIQVKRISKIREINEAKIKDLVISRINHPLLGVFGTETVNVLELNVALDQIK